MAFGVVPGCSPTKATTRESESERAGRGEAGGGAATWTATSRFAPELGEQLLAEDVEEPVGELLGGAAELVAKRVHRGEDPYRNSAASGR